LAAGAGPAWAVATTTISTLVGVVATTSILEMEMEIISTTTDLEL
jgi:hypothetical protein